MQNIREGAVGNVVSAWQRFLNSMVHGERQLAVDGIFGSGTLNSTRAYQRSRSLADDGVVGFRTLAAAVADGFSVAERTAFTVPMSAEQRARSFGAPNVEPFPAPGDPERVKLDPAWVKRSIVSTVVPGLASSTSIAGAPKGGIVSCHILAAPRLIELFVRWSHDGLLDRILSWDGMWVPRFIRGSRVTLSNHALGTAFDINARWNSLGTLGAPAGAVGSVRELVASANELGWFWGGNFASRPDPMHFELARL